MAKVHIAVSSEPLKFGEDLEVLCGASVPKAQSVPFAESGSPESSVLFCKPCFEKWRYVSCVVTGEESIRIGREEIEVDIAS